MRSADGQKIVERQLTGRARKQLRSSTAAAAAHAAAGWVAPGMHHLMTAPRAWSAEPSKPADVPVWIRPEAPPKPVTEPALKRKETSAERRERRKRSAARTVISAVPHGPIPIPKVCYYCRESFPSSNAWGRHYHWCAPQYEKDGAD